MHGWGYRELTVAVVAAKDHYQWDANFPGTVGIPVIRALAAWVAFADLGPWSVAMRIAAEALHETVIGFLQVGPASASANPERTEYPDWYGGLLQVDSAV